MLKAGPMPGMTVTNGIDGVAKQQREEVEKIQQDVFLLSQRIADAKGEPIPVRDSSSNVPDSANSPFVSGLRALADAERRGRDLKEQKTQHLESLLEKVNEYERLILAKTTPAETSNGSQRRKSFGSELVSLPMHFRVIDRLLDLHTQSKRVTVIRTTGQAAETAKPPVAEASPQLTNELNDLRSRLAKMRESYETLENRLKTSESRTQQLENTLQETTKQHKVALDTQAGSAQQDIQRQKQIHAQEMQKKLQEQQSQLEAQHKSHIERLNQQLETLTTEDSAKAQQLRDLEFRFQQQAEQQKNAGAIVDDSELIRLRAEVRRLQTRLEEEVEINTSVLSTVQGKTAALLATHEDSAHTYHYNHSRHHSQLPTPFAEALIALDEAIEHPLKTIKAELQLVLRLKEVLEGDLQTVTLQRDLLSQDFSALQEQNEALRGAYHSLSYETATQQSNQSANKQSTEEIQALKQQIEQQQATITTLQNSLDMQKLQLRTFEQWPKLVAELEERMRDSNTEKARLETQLKSAQAESVQFAKLVEQLKQKIKDLCNKAGASAGRDSDFLDSFEEVLQDEMTTMKMAFEAKLRAAREEADALSRKHAAEIQRMQQSPSYGSLPKLSGGR